MSEKPRYLLIGGFAAGHAAASIREHDKHGHIVIVGQESHPPYDRPPLSKDALVHDDFGPDDPHSKPDDFYAKHHIELKSGQRAAAIDRTARTVQLDSGKSLAYEKLLLATGATPRVPNVPGNEGWGVFYLRTVDDALSLRGALQQAKRTVVVGASYMGLEVASGCLKRGLETTIIDHNRQPWPKFASPQLGRFMREQYEAAGARFIFGDEAMAFQSNGDGAGQLARVLTKNAGAIAADVAIVCAGVTLNTQLAQDAGLEVDDKEGVVVNESLRTSDPHIWAAGDIACFEDRALGKRWHVEHYMNAQWQGQAAGAIMAEVGQPYDRVAYFFSDFLDLHMILRGDPQAGQNTKVRGDLARGEFVELYHDDTGRLRMGVALSHDEKKLEPISDKLEELIRAKTKVDGIKTEDFGL